MDTKTQIGLTFGELMSVLFLLITMFGMIVTFIVKIASIKTMQDNEKERLDKHIEQNDKDFEKFISDNKADHCRMEEHNRSDFARVFERIELLHKDIKER